MEGSDAVHPQVHFVARAEHGLARNLIQTTLELSVQKIALVRVLAIAAYQFVAFSRALLLPCSCLRVRNAACSRTRMEY
jgi:hypothetical protein